MRVLSRVFRGKFVAGPRRAFRNHQLALHGAWASLNNDTAFAAFLRTLFRQDWVVYANKPKAIGAYNAQLPRSSPTLWNIGYQSEFYWDGRSKSLEAQAKAAWSGGNMGASGKDGRPSMDDVCATLNQNPGYRHLPSGGLPDHRQHRPDHRGQQRFSRTAHVPHRRFRL